MTRTRLAATAVCIGMMAGCADAPRPVAESTESSLGASSASVVESDVSLESVPDRTPSASESAARAKELFATIVKAAESGDAESWSNSEKTLNELGLSALPALQSGLTDANPIARELAAMFLAQLGPDAAPAADDLVKLLDESSTFARVNAAAALSTFEGHAERVAPVLTSLLNDEDVNVRITAATALRNIGGSASEAINGLVALLRDSDSRVRLAAATTLGEIGPMALASISSLRDLEDDEDEQVKTAALRAIKRIDETARTAPVTIPASATE